MDMDAEIRHRYEHKQTVAIVAGIVLVVLTITIGIVGYNALMLSYGYEYRQVPIGETRGAWVKALAGRKEGQ